MGAARATGSLSFWRDVFSDLASKCGPVAESFDASTINDTGIIGPSDSLQRIAEDFQKIVEVRSSGRQDDASAGGLLLAPRPGGWNRNKGMQEECHGLTGGLAALHGGFGCPGYGFAIGGLLSPDIPVDVKAVPALADGCARPFPSFRLAGDLEGDECFM